MTIALLTNPIQRYDWGSHTDIASLQGRAPSDLPEAELWMGGYPESSSKVFIDGTSVELSQVISHFVSDEIQRSFGQRLPFLMKFLAIARPLSIQSHPSAQHAQSGHAEGIFKDPYAKPELIYALSSMEMLCGFRPASDVIAYLAHLGREDLIDELEESTTGALFVRLLSDPTFLNQVKEATHLARELPWLPEILIKHPHDPAGIAPLFLNHIALSPGEALFVPEERVHCYLRGFGVEVMGASDNVVRAGLTSKAVDIPHFVENVDLHSSTPHVVTATDHDGWTTWQTPAREFQLSKATGAVSSQGLAIFTCSDGHFTLRDDHEVLEISRGEALIASSDSKVEITGSGELFRCSLPV